MPKKKLDIIYEDKYLIIINKPSGILTISRDNRNEKNGQLFDCIMSMFIIEMIKIYMMKLKNM